MSTQLMKKISGQLTDAEGNALRQIPFGITVTLTRSSESNNPGGWIGSSAIHITDGSFEIFTAYDLPAVEEVSYSVLRDKTVLQSGTIVIDNFMATISLTDAHYNNMFAVETTGYTVIKGSLTLGAENVIASPRVSDSVDVQLDKKGFRTLDLLGTTKLDDQGRFELKVPNTSLYPNDSKCKTSSPIQLLLTISAEGNYIAEITETLPAECSGTINIQLDAALTNGAFFTELEYYLYTLSSVAGIAESEIHSIGNEGTGSELIPLAAVTCLDEHKLKMLVDAALLASDLNVGLAKVYGLLRTTCRNVYEMVALTPDELYQTLSGATNIYAVPEITSIDDIAEALDIKRGILAGEEPTENNEALWPVLGVILGSELDALTFLKLSEVSSEEDTELLWQKVDEALGTPLTTRLQKGLQLLAITGEQAEITVTLLDYLGSQPVSSLAINEELGLEAMIIQASATYNKICIPKVIQDNFSPEEAISFYAVTIRNALTDIFATTVLAGKMTSDSIFAGKISNLNAVKDFLEAHTSFDLRADNVWDEDKVPDEPVRQGLIPLQNITRLAGGEPRAVVALIKAGMKSSYDIVDMAEDDFVLTFKDFFNGGEQQARSTYVRASHANRLNMEAKVAMSTSNYISDVFPMLTTEESGGSNLTASIPPVTPDLNTLFGNMELCNCAECTSMYSPGAYFTDILNFMQKKLGTAPSKAYKELKRRRPDLMDIDLTCKNANTPVPYVDLVNELLEKTVLKFVTPNVTLTVPIPGSFQTSGTAKELEAYPEHTYKQGSVYKSYSDYKIVYNDTLKNAVYPNNLPFDLPLEEARTYMKHLGVNRYDLMHQFRSQNYANTTEETNALAEWLKIPAQEAEIISDPYVANKQTKAFFGMESSTWFDVLRNGENGEGLGTLLHRSRISYKEMLQMLACDYLNPEIQVTELINQSFVTKTIRTFTIKSTDIQDQDTCDLTKLTLYFNRVDEDQNPLSSGVLQEEKKFFFDKWHRFLRLKRATGWSFYQLDTILHSFGITGFRTYNSSGNPVTSSDINEAVFRYVAKTHQLATLFKLAPEKVCTLWSTISQTRYTNFDSDSQDKLPSLYDNLFRNKAVLNPVNPAFEENGNINGTYANLVPSVIAAFGLKDEEWEKLRSYWQISSTLTLENLSPAYGSSLLSKALKVPVAELIELGHLLEVNLVAITPAERFQVLEDFLADFMRLKKIAFSIDETNYLIANQDPQFIFSKDADIETFFTTLRSDLQKVSSDVLRDDATQAEQDAAAELKAAKRLSVIEQHFAFRFSLERETAHTLLEDTEVVVTSVITPLGLALQYELFINEDEAIKPEGGVTGLEYSELYTAYRKLDRVARIINRLKISFEEFAKFSTYSTELQTGIIENIISDTVTGTNEMLHQFIALNEWIMIRDHLGAGKEQFLLLLEHAASDASGNDWKNIVREITRWDGTDFENIIDILNLNFVAYDQRNSSLLLQIADIISSAQILSLKPLKIYNLLIPGVTMDQSKDVRLAAKAHYTDDAWAKVAKPLQDVLRERQRQSLVAYITGTPEVLITINSTNGNTIKSSCKNENELFGFLLIDVEMKPCMKTSRIKQGISSAQLFMDRVVLSLENENGVYGNLISITADKIAQWESWRKWYRVWEANRKIFLYPENWIEPELRDDKTPFFKDLETQLLQDEVKEDTAKDAYLSYLEKVDEVARLEPITSYREIDSTKGIDILHVFARTYAEPHRYFYRKLQDNEWTPWQKMSVDIKSDHIVPYMWNNRLFVFWLSFKSKKPATSVANPGTWVSAVTGQGASAQILKDTDNDKNTVMEITLNWSEFKDNKWLSTQFGREAMTLDLSRIRLGSETSSSYQQPSPVLNKFSKQFGNDGDMKIEELFKSRIRLFITHIQYDPKQDLIFNVQFVSGLNDVALGLHSFVWQDSSTEPRLATTDYGHTTVAPKGTRFRNMKLVQYDYAKLNVTNTYGFGYGYYIYHNNYMHSTAKILNCGTSDVVLDSTPYGTYRVTPRNNVIATGIFPERDPMDNNFFFDDGKNTFYVQKETGTYSTQQQKYIKMQEPAKITLKSAKDFSVTKYNPPVLLQATPAGSIFTYSAPTGDRYRFHTFYHAQINEFTKELNRNGVPGLLKLSNQKKFPDQQLMKFQDNYQPNMSRVHANFPTDDVQFGFDQAYGIYNWEIFFHAPMMIAQRLSDNQQFEEARKWYHYIFDPTSTKDIANATATDKKRFWKFYPFYEKSQATTQTLTDLLIAINNGQLEALKQVDKWEKNPFKPHVIARLRMLAYMKNVLMKYLDNLFAWADQLFSRDTIESINEATQLYILAAHLLGKRPEEVPARGSTGAKTYDQLNTAGLDALSNAMVQIESYFAPNDGPLPTSGGKDDHGINVPMFYFCLPKNDKLLKYWDSIADRLFKIRNCMNIDGTVRQLPLYEPPIDPALLVRAAAAGISAGAVLNSVSGNSQSPYRFSYVLQKANEFTNDVKALGSSLLSAIEKKDAEQLALLRSGQEMQLLERIRSVKEIQIQEAEANLEAVNRTKENTQMRQLYYGSRVFMNGGETQHLSSLQTGMILQAVQGGLSTAAGVVALIPQFHGQILAAVGASFGGQHIAGALNAASSAVGIAAAINSGKGSMALTRAGYERRMDDWKFQASAAGKELEQLDQQILAAEIRLDMARRELSNHELQIANTSETDAYMRSKFSNTELYNWMISQISATYFQSYQLAFDMAKKAEACFFDIELPAFQKPAGGFIGFAYWDSLRKGLLSGEKLQFDLRKMESAYMDANKRELELTRNVSLVMTDPKALLDLRKNGVCDIFIPEELYDMDYPGHYLRRIKSVSISLPCITGPYTTVAATLTLMESMMRMDALTNAAPTPENTVLLPSIATSGGQNDSGVFELNFRDERYLPFEGRGAISRWELRLADETQLRQFDFETIADVIMHVKYTARDGGTALRAERRDAIIDIVTGTPATASGFEHLLLPRYFSLKHEFSTEWYAAFQSTVMVGSSNVGRQIPLRLRHDQFPDYTKNKAFEVSKIDFYLTTTSPVPSGVKYKVKYGGTAYEIATQSTNSGTLTTTLPFEASDIYNDDLSFVLYREVTNGGTVTLQKVEQSDLSDLFMVMHYKLN